MILINQSNVQTGLRKGNILYSAVGGGGGHFIMAIIF